MKAVAAGDGMCIPMEPGDGAGAKEDGDGTGKLTFPGEGTRTLDGDGTIICVNFKYRKQKIINIQNQGHHHSNNGWGLKFTILENCIPLLNLSK